MKKLFANLVVLFSTLIICLLLFEGLLHLTSPVSCKQSDLLLDHSNRPDCETRFKTFEWDIDVKINSLGLRDDEILPKEKFEQRILMLGDSFTWGYGVEKEEAFVDVLDQRLGIEVDVVNAGVTSYSPSLEYLYLKNRGLLLEPDVVVLAFDQSDLQDDYIREREGVFEEGELVAVPKEEPSGLLYKIRNNIRLTRFIGNLIRLIDAKSVAKDGFDLLTSGNITKDRYAITRFEKAENEKEYWQRTFSYILKIRNLAEENDIDFVLITYPYAHQISIQEWNEGRHLFGFEKGKIYSNRGKKVLEDFSLSEDIEFISLFDDFKDSQEFPLYFAYDGHFNKDGHKLVGEVLARELVSRRIIGGIIGNETKSLKDNVLFTDSITKIQTKNGK